MDFHVAAMDYAAPLRAQEVSHYYRQAVVLMERLVLLAEAANVFHV